MLCDVHDLFDRPKSANDSYGKEFRLQIIPTKNNLSANDTYENEFLKHDLSLK